ncbi:hypothetical protein C8A01DRAFT_35044 [Parachaetomium inaequale]|uniref:Uncharacterized protein n=1 Tax=Parachaetomium inaequale TaxID=2588326 RepID=A0AAN6SSZ4_9PEZI|nr:hypothetical protein C8A01DRAFT_35044 [Parachaetomium inaequale]
MDSKPSQQPNPGPSPQPGPADSPTRMVIAIPFPDDATFEAVRQDFLRRAAENVNDSEFQTIMRLGAFEGSVAWVLDNFPEKDGFVYWPLDEFPRDIQYGDDKKGGEVVTVPQADTRLFLMGRRRADHEDARVDGKKQGGLACVALCALPPAGVGEGGMAGTPMARGTGETPAMDAAEKALLGFVRELQDVGCQEQAPMGEAVDGSTRAKKALAAAILVHVIEPIA